MFKFKNELSNKIFNDRVQSRIVICIKLLLDRALVKWSEQIKIN